MTNILEDKTELEKISAISEKSNIIGQFLDWLYEQGYILAKYGKHDYLEDSSIRTEKLLASYFNIDLNKAESERISLLDDLRIEKERSKKPPPIMSSDGQPLGNRLP